MAKLSHDKQMFIDWLCTPKQKRQPATQGAYAEQNCISESTLKGWKQNDKEFQEEWDSQYKRTVGSPEKAQAVILALLRTATDEEDPRQVPAARAYLEAINAIKPPRMDITVKRGAAADLTDDELVAAMAEHAAREFERRGHSSILDADVPKMVDYQESADKE